LVCRHGLQKASSKMFASRSFSAEQFLNDKDKEDFEEQYREA